MAEIEAPRLVFLVVMLMFFYLTPDLPQSTPSQRREHGDKVNEAREAFGLMLNSTYNQFDPSQERWMNLTGLKEDDRYAWELLPKAKDAARQQLISMQKVYGDEAERSYEEARTVPMPLYQNVSGSVEGKFVKMDLPPIMSGINLTTLAPGNEYVTNEFIRNVTDKEGEITLRFSEDSQTIWDGDQRLVSSIVTDTSLYTSSSPGSGWDVRLYGVHVHKAGVIIATTSSEKFDGIFALPQFALYKNDFELSKQLLNQSIAHGLTKWEKSMDGPSSSSPWSSNVFDAGSALFPTPACELIFYLQQHPIYLSKNGDDTNILKSIEDELHFPMGAPVPSLPPITMSATIFSPDCGFILQSRGLPEVSEKPNHLSGPRREAFWGLTRNVLLALVVLLGIQIALIKRQVDEASTPSTRSRISYYSIGLMTMGDGLMVSGLIGFLMMSQSVFHLVAAASFLCFFNIAIMEMRFIFDIWTVQVGDLLQRQRERDRQEAQAMTRQTNAPPQIGTTPAPTVANATAARPLDTGATPIILPPDQEIELAAEEDERLLPPPAAAAGTAAPAPSPARQIASDFGTIYARFYFTILATVLISCWAYSWPKALRSAYANVLCFIYLSFWVPQIHRNVIRNCRKALRWEYVFGISVCRLVPILYCYAKEGNPMSFDLNTSGAIFFVFWVWAQILVLLSQQFLGPRLFVKESWCPPAYDYHPILRDDADDPEAGSTLPIGFVASASEAKDADSRDKNNNTKVIDCAICMQEIEVPVVSKNENDGRGATWLGRMNYMVTPCRHIFHSQCLEGWMRLRLACPVCREGLPPI